MYSLDDPTFWANVARLTATKLQETRGKLAGIEAFLIGCTKHSAARAQEVVDHLRDAGHLVERGGVYQVKGMPELSDILTWMHREGLFDPAKHPAGC